MPKFNADDKTQLAEPIVVTLDGKDYTVGKVSHEMLSKIDEIAKAGGIDAPYQQLAHLVGVEQKDLADVDIRKVGAALEFITNAIQDGVKKPKNS